MPTAVLVDAPAGVPGAELLGALIGDRCGRCTYPSGTPTKIGCHARRLRGDPVIWSPTSPSRDPVSSATGRGRQCSRPPCRRRCCVADSLSCMRRFGSTGRRYADDAVGRGQGRSCGACGLDCAAHHIGAGIGSGTGCFTVRPNVALHITQSGSATASSLAITADSLRTALSAEPDGIFVEFNPSDRRADRDAVTYREVRSDHHVAWTVLLDGAVRIAVGCQSPSGSEYLVREACDRAIRSAHAVF